MAQRKPSYEFKAGSIVLPADKQTFSMIRGMVTPGPFHPIMKVDEVEERPGKPPLVTVSHFSNGGAQTLVLSGDLLDHPRNATSVLADWLAKL